MSAKKRKGQMSFDMIFAIIAMLVFLQFISGFANDFIASQNTISLRDQAFSIGVEVKDALTSCQFLTQPGSQAKVRFKLPIILSAEGSTECKISLKNAKGTSFISVIPVGANGEVTNAEALVPAPEASNFSNAECGKVFNAC